MDTKIETKEGYYNTFDPKKNYDRIRFYPRPLQSRELNELQEIQAYQQKLVSTMLFGKKTVGNLAKIEDNIFEFSGQVLLDGAFRNVEGQRFSVDPSHNQIVAKAKYEEVTAQEDINLKEPFNGETFGEEGAARRQCVVELFSRNSSESQENENSTVLFKKSGSGNFVPASEACPPNYDLAIKIENLDGFPIPDNSKVLIKGGSIDRFRQINIKANNCLIDFAHTVEVWGKGSFPEPNGDNAFFHTYGNRIQIKNFFGGKKSKVDSSKKWIVAKAKEGSLFLENSTVFNMGNGSHIGSDNGAEAYEGWFKNIEKDF